MLSFILLALSILCLVLGSLFIWMRASAFSPNGYVASALQVEGQVLLKDQVTQYIEDDLLSPTQATDLALKVVDPLPINDQQKKLLAAGIATGVRSQVGNAVSAFFDSGPGKQIGEALSARLSEEVVKLVQDGDGVFRFVGDSIVFDPSPIIQNVRTKVESALGDFSQLLPPPKTEGTRQFVLLQGSTVTTIQKAISTIWLLAWLLPLLFLVFLVAGLITARQRRAAALRAMIAIIIGLVIAVVAVRIAKSVISNLVQQGPGQNVVDSILTSATSDLVVQTLWILLIASIVSFFLWLAGPDRPARYARGWLVARWRDLRAGRPGGNSAGRPTDFARRYRLQLDILGVVLMCIAFIAVPSLGTGTLVLGFVSLAVWLFLIEYAACARWLQAVARWLHDARVRIGQRTG